MYLLIKREKEPTQTLVPKILKRRVKSHRDQGVINIKSVVSRDGNG